MNIEKTEIGESFAGDDYTYIAAGKLKGKRIALTKKDEKAFCESIKANGFYDPLIIDTEYNIIDGAKRYCAAVRLGIDYIPCIFHEKFPEKQHVPSYTPYLSTAASEFSHFFSKAQAIYKLTDKYLMTQETVAALLDKSQSYIANKLRLLKFTPHQTKLITDGELTERHARAFLKIKEVPVRTAAIEHTVNASLNVLQTEEYVDTLCCNGSDENDSRICGLRTTVKTIDGISDTASRMGVLLKMNRSEDSSCISYTIKIFK